jgi:hypothetical protein
VGAGSERLTAEVAELPFYRRARTA